MSVWAVLALALLLLCFFKCEEKVQIEARKKDEKLPVPTMLKALFTNQYFWAVMILWTVQSVSFTITGTILPYYCKYIFNNDTWMYSALFLTETLVLVVGIFVCSPLIKKFGKRNIAFIGGFVALGGQLLFFLNPYSFGFMVMSCVTRAIGLAPLNAVVFSMVGDVVEFGQWKNHIRQESLIFAGGSIGTKSWCRSCISNDHRTVKQLRICKLICRNNCTAGNSTGDDRFPLQIRTDPHCGSDHRNTFRI